ncbi:hypothetical protein BN2877_13540 [Achromobacter xylosoxidans]|nr:hypothetical protein BN2877_13540 [Achromobacter xylosoxidans]
MNDFPSTTAGPAVANDIALRQMMRPISRYMAEDLVREVTIPRPGLILARRWGQWQHSEDALLTYDYLQALVSAMASFNSVNFSSIMSLLMDFLAREDVLRAWREAPAGRWPGRQERAGQRAAQRVRARTAAQSAPPKKLLATQSRPARQAVAGSAPWAERDDTRSSHVARARARVASSMARLAWSAA